jgi:hypothetical protein
MRINLVKKLVLIFGFIVLGIGLINQTATSKEKKYSWEELWDSSNTYMNSSDWKNGLEWGEKALVLAEKDYDKDDSVYHKSLYICFQQVISQIILRKHLYMQDVIVHWCSNCMEN